MTVKRNGALSFWKFIFCMIIVVHYAYFFKPAKFESASFFFYRGEIAFDFFFLLTGAMLARHMDSLPEGRTLVWTDTWSCIKGILRRYLPALVICWAVTFAVLNKVLFIDFKGLYTNFFGSVLELLPLHSAGFEIMPADPNTLVGYRVMDQAWVFSAVVLSVLIIYPLYRSNKKRFEYYIAPVGAALIMCFIFFRAQVLTGDKVLLLDAKNKALYFFPPGTYKAVGEILAGVACRTLVRHLSRKDISKAKSRLLSVAEIGCFLVAILYMQFMLRFEIPKRYDFLAVGFILIGIAVSLSGKSSINELCNNRFFDFLGRFSLYPFLTFMVFAKTLPHFLHGMSIGKMTLIYVGLTLLSALIVMLLEKPFVKLVKACKKLIVKPREDTV